MGVVPFHRLPVLYLPCQSTRCPLDLVEDILTPILFFAFQFNKVAGYLLAVAGLVRLLSCPLYCADPCAGRMLARHCPRDKRLPALLLSARFQLHCIPGQGETSLSLSPS